ncbi:PEP-CTERM sorting domain-containing protein [Symmachiella dynata]|uniref:PEP-CTERM sorting domain-containing protein n=1 Tax=Symmachiella dynata TaxID=2527995 RepID=UPI0030EF5ECC
MKHVFLASMVSLGLVLGAVQSGKAGSLGPDFASDYTLTSLGSVPGVPLVYGGLTLKLGDPNTLLLGGNANSPGGNLYEVAVTRDSNGHITGFGSVVPFGDVGEYNDGGVVYGPNDVLFTAQWNANNLGQTKPGSTDEDRVDALGPYGIGGSSISALNFVPSGFANAGAMKVVSWSTGNWYDVAYAPDGFGTFDILSATQVDLDPIAPGIQSLPGGPEGFIYVEAGNAGFPVASMLVSDYSDNQISAYEVDSLGNPILSTRRIFASDVIGAEGAFRDPVTGDFLFSTFGGANEIIRVEGFQPIDPPPPTAVPEPSTFALLGIGGLALVGYGVRRKRQQAA